MRWGKRFFLHAPLRRLCALLVGLFLLTGLSVSLCLAPLENQRRDWQEKNIQKQRDIARLAAKSSPRPAQHKTSAATRSFTLNDLLEHCTGRLITLRQSGQRCTLILTVPWPEIPRLFTRLSTYRDIRQFAFHLQRAEHHIQVTLRIERDDENE